MLRSNYRYSRDHHHQYSHHHHHQHPLSSSPPVIGGSNNVINSCSGCSGSSPVSIFFEEMESHWGETAVGGATVGHGAAIGQSGRQGSLKHLSISALGRRAREGFRRCQTSRDSTAGISQSFEASVLQQQAGGSTNKLVKILGEEVKSDEKVLFDHFYDRGRRNAFANIFCGLSSRGLRRLFAVYGIDEVQTKAPAPPTTGSSGAAAVASLTDSHHRERRRHRLDMSSSSRGGSVESRDSSGGGGGGGGSGGGGYRQRAGSANQQLQRQRRRRQPQLSQHQQLAAAAFTLLGCGRSSSADDERDDQGGRDDVGREFLGCRSNAVEDLGVVKSADGPVGRLGPN